MASFESQIPRRRSGQAWWDVLKLVRGTTWHGHLAGPPVGVDCHFVGARRACRYSLTKGALECPYCADGLEPRFTGYVPLWGPDVRRWLLVMGDRHWSAIKDVPHLTGVHAQKTASRGEAIYCGRTPKQTAPPELVGADRKEQDFTGVLLTMWGDEALKEWCLAQAVQKKATPTDQPAKPPKKRNPVKPPADEQEFKVRTLGDWVAGVAAEMAATEGHDDLAERFKRRGQPSANGHAAPPKPK